jgi:hypothetical protein
MKPPISDPLKIIPSLARVPSLDRPALPDTSRIELRGGKHDTCYEHKSTCFSLRGRILGATEICLNSGGFPTSRDHAKKPSAKKSGRYSPGQFLTKSVCAFCSCP